MKSPPGVPSRKWESPPGELRGMGGDGVALIIEQMKSPGSY